MAAETIEVGDQVVNLQVPGVFTVLARRTEPSTTVMRRPCAVSISSRVPRRATTVNTPGTWRLIT